jgi:hypothetical protein
MFFWLRELFGWGLILVSLYMLSIGLAYVSDSQNPRIVEASIVLLTSVGVMRCGVLLVRVSAAARIALNMKKPEV